MVGRTGARLAFSMMPLIFLAAGARAQSGPPQHSPEGKTAAQVFKNIQVLKNIPADQLIPTMEFIAASLGVRCTFCHVEGAFQKDDKRPKRTARKMMQMMFAIDKENFGGRLVVTCDTCHNGSAHPASTPVIAAVSMPEQPLGTMHEGAKAMPPMPDHVVDQYMTAIGGQAAAAKISSRVETGTLTAFGGRKFQVTLYQKGADKTASYVSLPRGEMITTFNGKQGWTLGMGRPASAMNPDMEYADRVYAGLGLPQAPSTVFAHLRPALPKTIGGAETYVLLGISPGEVPVKLYFDKDSGLLVRTVTYLRTALGLYPEERDFSDYRATDGVKIPYHITIARPGGERFTIDINKVEQNVPISDSKFEKPAPAGGEPSSP